MQKEHEPHDARSSSESFVESTDPSVPSLTDLIDEMDRAAFRRSLASRDVTRRIQINSHNLRARPKD